MTRFSSSVALMFVMLCAPPALARDDDPGSSDVERAEGFAAEAFEAYGAKEYERAVSLYLKALDASPSSDILYNIARIYDTKLVDRINAREYYQRFVDDPEADAGRVQTAKERLQALREAGRARRELAPLPPAAAAASTFSAPPARPAQGMSSTRITGIIVGAVGIVAAGVGTALAFSAKADADLTHDLCDGNLCISQRGVDAAHDAETKANIATVTIIGGSALAAAGVTLILLGGNSTEREHASLKLTPSLLGARLSARF